MSDTGIYIHVGPEIGVASTKAFTGQVTVLKQNDKVREMSRQFTYAKNFLYLGRGYNYPVALEGALKLKEIKKIVCKQMCRINEHGTTFCVK